MFNMADGILTPCNVARGSGIMTVNSPSGSIGLPCKVTRGSGMTCHWIRQVAAPCNVTRSSGIVTIRQVAAPCNVAGGFGSGMTYAIEFAQTFAILEFYFWLWYRPYHRNRHVLLHQSTKFSPNGTTLGRKKDDVMSIFKMADLSHLGF